MYSVEASTRRTVNRRIVELLRAFSDGIWEANLLLCVSWRSWRLPSEAN